MSETLTAREVRLRCIEAAARLFHGRAGANQYDVLHAAEKFEAFVVFGKDAPPPERA